eukprot:gnl/Carplike_NY0171/6111_a8385_261.p1 GENE.gnl/Carplike_NY0171/6111_a8385_261~~gnl/Carplike_NY0171/6111_a8385_261.p1  ORF type:complete len:157 (+),score=18.33 gnl/Carplike_NY0171/6111_a8385_261:99-569(+)
MQNKNVPAVEKAIQYFEGEYNCAQSVIKALNGYSGLKMETAEALTAGFGGGIGGSQEICGAVSGACMAISHAVYNMYIDHEDRKDIAKGAVKEFMEGFKQEKKEVRCFELTGHDFSIESEKEKFAELGLKQDICFPAVQYAVSLAIDIIQAHEKGL